MELTPIRIFVQARLSSRRFPGKVLAPLAGRPVIDHVLERCAAVFGPERVVLATSDHASDDGLAAHVRSKGYALFRGDLADVVRRFQQCLRQHACEWFVRISGDSPLIDPELVAQIAERREAGYDLVTNVQTRTFPPGQSVEVIRAECFAGIDSARLSAEEREHATLAFYRAPGRYRILNVLSRDPKLAHQSFTVDTIEDLRVVEALIAAGTVPTFASAIAGPA
jgi:spore coat polysaccharide biosynthesis protein SpsF